MLDTRVGSWKNLFGRLRSPMQAKQVRPQRGPSQETDHEDHTPHGNELSGKIIITPAGKSIISQENATRCPLLSKTTQRGVPCLANSYESP